MELQQANQSTSSLFDIAQFRQIYKKFNADTVRKLPDIYSPTIIFKDPVHQINGIAELSDYFASLCNPEMQCEFEITNEIASDNQAFFQWKMHYQHPRLKAGTPLILDGGTLIKFNTKIVYHEDFYDMGAMIYQHIPILGWAVKKINARIAGQSS
ncbi:transcriptional regulator [Cellvibrio zantedeschiae]|uniref:Transcriptional regulator n=1 Tax=Cellvibrio zantedeschiae TaxID=1237077 RepID=A0ABQ3B1V3_9GAMM|nr:nuclear transport factor 2 family protein [Cellvibrio zantedeschiae]GGY75418.1 transcriptional regulator [Cellvibrio zantedeschiae]